MITFNRRKCPNLSDLVDFSPHEWEYIPRGWQILGNIIIVNIHPELAHRKHEIGKALLAMYPRCNRVLLDRGIRGQFREPDRELIAATEDADACIAADADPCRQVFETVHKENGCMFKLDAKRIMFSQGNFFERNHMSRLGKGEFVIDMFAGIGYFSVPMAVHSRPGKILAVELNPAAFSYLLENIRMNKIGDIIEPVNADCKDVVPEVPADRVIMGYVLTTHHYLERGIRNLKDGGILHYHETVPEPLMFERPVRRIQNAADVLGVSVEILDIRKIKKYSPGVWHVVVDARISSGMTNPGSTR